MSLNRTGQTKRIIRLIVLLSGPCGYSIAQLSKRFEVGQKTVRRDLRAIEELEIPLYEDSNSDAGDDVMGNATKLWRVDRHWMRRFQ